MRLTRYSYLVQHVWPRRCRPRQTSACAAIARRQTLTSPQGTAGDEFIAFLGVEAAFYYYIAVTFVLFGVSEVSSSAKRRPTESDWGSLSKVCQSISFLP